VLPACALACARDRRPATSDTLSSGRASSSASSSAGTAGWRAVVWEAHAGVDPGDLGRGVAFLEVGENKGARDVEDTLMLRSSPDSGAPPVGAMLLALSPNGGPAYRVAAPDSLRPNLVEYGYEESGVPFDSTDAAGRWARGILGFRGDGSSVTGWIDTQAPGVGSVRWAEQLADRPIFFPKPEQAAFYSEPDSTRRVPTPPNEPEYAIYPVEARGSWLRVRVVQPSDNCVGPDSIPRRTRMLWIQYLDDRGRPNVWYYTRGC